MEKTVLFSMLLVGSLLMAQVNGNQRAPNSHKGQLTAQGCVGRSSGYYIFMQEGNSYALEARHKIDFGHYLGQRVEVTGSVDGATPHA